MSASALEAGVREVIESLAVIAARDGGQLALVSLDPANSAVTVSYREGKNDACETCSIPSEMMVSFLQEGFRSHSIPVSTVEVVAA